MESHKKHMTTKSRPYCCVIACKRKTCRISFLIRLIRHIFVQTTTGRWNLQLFLKCLLEHITAHSDLLNALEHPPKNRNACEVSCKCGMYYSGEISEKEREHVSVSYLRFPELKRIIFCRTRSVPNIISCCWSSCLREQYLTPRFPKVSVPIQVIHSKWGVYHFVHDHILGLLVKLIHSTC